MSKTEETYSVLMGNIANVSSCKLGNEVKTETITKIDDKETGVYRIPQSLRLASFRYLHDNESYRISSLDWSLPCLEHTQYK